ncbi:MAG: response regulator transcription factor [bacterium]|nr:response regulator transcription factor [bacterium]
MKSILLIEDDSSLGATLKERLEKEDFKVSWAKLKSEAEDLISRFKFDLVILDIGLPDGNGFDIAKKIKTKDTTPFIFVTAMNTAEYRLTGYELGADEYIPKPFHLKELLLRIRKVLGSEVKLEKIIKLGDLVIDLEAMTIVYADGKVEYPTSRDFSILKFLIQVAPKVISREEILKEVCSESSETAPTLRTIDNSIVRLRQLLGDNHKCIRSVRGIGYQFIAQ